MRSNETNRSSLSVRVVPGARSDKLSWEPERGWIARIAAPPVDGKANQHLCQWLAREILGVAPSLVRVRQGASGRAKVLEIDLDAATVDTTLRRWVEEHP